MAAPSIHPATLKVAKPVAEAPTKAPAEGQAPVGAHPATLKPAKAVAEAPAKAPAKGEATTEGIIVIGAPSHDATHLTQA